MWTCRDCRHLVGRWCSKANGTSSNQGVMAPGGPSWCPLRESDDMQRLSVVIQDGDLKARAVAAQERTAAALERIVQMMWSRNDPMITG